MEIYPHQKYDQFNLVISDEAQCVTKFHFAKRDLSRLSDVLQIIQKIVCC